MDDHASDIGPEPDVGHLGDDSEFSDGLLGRFMGLEAGEEKESGRGQEAE